METLSLDDYREAMREDICSVCVSFVPSGENPARCAYETSGACSLFAHLQDVVDSVSSLESGSIEPYLAALRHDVCANCSHQNSRGFCDVRDSHAPVPTWCALDTYFNLIVGTIEEMRQAKAR